MSSRVRPASSPCRSKTRSSARTSSSSRAPMRSTWSRRRAMISIPVRSPRCTVRSKLWPANAFWWSVPSAGRSKRQPKRVSSSSDHLRRVVDERPGELLVVEVAAARRACRGSGASSESRRVEHGVVAALHHPRAAGAADGALADERDRRASGGGRRACRRAHQPGAAAADDRDVGRERRRSRRQAPVPPTQPAEPTIERGGVESLRAGRRCSRGCSGSGRRRPRPETSRAARRARPSRGSAISTIARLSAAGPRKSRRGAGEVAGRRSRRRTGCSRGAYSTCAAARIALRPAVPAPRSSAGTNHGLTRRHCVPERGRVDDQVADDGQAGERLEHDPRRRRRGARVWQASAGRPSTRTRRCRTWRRGTSSGSPTVGSHSLDREQQIEDDRRLDDLDAERAPRRVEAALHLDLENPGRARRRSRPHARRWSSR